MRKKKQNIIKKTVCVLKPKVDRLAESQLLQNLSDQLLSSYVEGEIRFDNLCKRFLNIANGAHLETDLIEQALGKLVTVALHSAVHERLVSKSKYTGAFKNMVADSVLQKSEHVNRDSFLLKTEILLLESHGVLGPDHTLTPGTLYNWVLARKKARGMAISRGRPRKKEK